MTIINSTGNALTGATGANSFVGSVGATLVTPNIGVANLTSIDFGGGALSVYTPPTSFTPGFTFATVGNLSISYATQIGYYIKKGNKVYLFILLTFTPTYTTASGAASITSLPFTSTSISTNSNFQFVTLSNTFSYGSNTQLQGIIGAVGSTTLAVQREGSGSRSALNAAQMPSGVQHSMQVQGWYFI